jgi:transposase, IS6 family
MIERGIQVDHSTIMRWVHQYSPEIEKKNRKHLRPTNNSWRVDETYIKVKGRWKYFYRAVDSNGIQLISCKVQNEIEERRRDSLRNL